MRLAAFVFILVLVLSACRAPTLASEEDCVAYHERISTLLGKKPVTDGGINPLLAGYCKQRGMTADYVECIRRSPTLDDAERCRPRRDARASSQRPDEPVCHALTTHIDKLVTGAMPSAKPPSFNARRVAHMECMRWETVTHVECQLKATSLEQLDSCGL